MSGKRVMAQREKERTYTNEVLILALKPYGRWQPSASQTIHTIAQALAQTGRRSAASIRRRLGEDIETALIQGISDTTLNHLGHINGLPSRPIETASPSIAQHSAAYHNTAQQITP